jgi:hypothetical protein
MVKTHNMASGDNTIPGSPSEYFTPTKGEQGISYPPLDKSGRGAGGPILTPMPTAGGTPAMRGATVNYPNSNTSGIRSSIDDGATPKGGMKGKKVNPEAPYRNPVSGTNPTKPVQRKPKR